MNMELSLSHLTVLLTAHWFGDYVLQTNVIAKEKSRSIKWLLIHVAMYTTVLFICTIVIFPYSMWLPFLVVNASLHLITDFLTSKLSQKFHSNQRLYFVIIGFDQLIHSITLLGSVYLLA
jgi:hypothetical protein